MTVSQASLKNLIPQPRKWSEFTTTPIRVPENLKNWVLEMIDQKITELRFAIGNIAPSEQSEQTWINEILGFPEGYQDGDPLPENIAVAVQEAAAAKLAAAEVPAAVAEAAEVPAVVMPEPEPPDYTQAWIDWNVRNFPGWNWPEYLAAIKLDVREGHQSAKDDLAAFKRNGIDISGGGMNEKQAARQAAKLAQSGNAAATFGSATARFGNSGDKPRAKVAATATANTKPVKYKAADYRQVKTLYLAHRAECLDALGVFMLLVKETCTPGKLKEFDDWLVQHYCYDGNFEVYPPKSEWCEAWYLRYKKALEDHVIDLRMTFERQDKSRDCINNRFVDLVTLCLSAWDCVDWQFYSNNK